MDTITQGDAVTNQKNGPRFTVREADVQKVFDHLDVAAKDFGCERLAERIGKAQSTLRNELAGLPGHKLGVITSLQILAWTGDLRALDRLEAVLGRVAVEFPRSTRNDPAPLMAASGRLAKEFGEHMSVLGAALMDGVIEPREARACLKELDEAVKAALAVRVHLEGLCEEGGAT